MLILNRQDAKSAKANKGKRRVIGVPANQWLGAGCCGLVAWLCRARQASSGLNRPAQTLGSCLRGSDARPVFRLNPGFQRFSWRSWRLGGSTDFPGRTKTVHLL